jgi:hypothetical protein
VRISQIASKTIPIFLLARVLVIATVTSSFVPAVGICFC